MSADKMALIDTIVVILIFLAIIVEIFLEWRWHKEAMRKNKKNNDQEDAC